MRILLRLFVFARKYWWLLLLAFICIGVSTVSSLAIPRIIGEGIDTVIGYGERSFLWLAAGILVGASALRGLAEYGSRYFREVASQKTAYDIRNALYNQLQGLSFAYYDKAQTGQLMSRGTVDVEAVRMFFGMGLLGMVGIVAMSTAVSYMLIAMDWKLALLTLAFMPAIAWRAIVVSGRLRPIWLKIQQLMGVTGTTLEESLTGVRVVKGFSRQKEEGQKFSAGVTALYNEEIKGARLRAFNIPIIIFLISLPIALILWYGGRQVIAGNLTIGNLSQFIMYLGMLAMPMRQLGMMVNIFSRTVSAGERILEILDTRSPVQEKPNAIELDHAEGQVSFENVSFSYNPVVPVLNNISFSVKPGELVALLGVSGSGKSTIANLLCRFYDVSSGRITIDGIDINDVTLASLRKNVVAAQQDIFLFSATIRDNIAYGGANASMEQIEAVAKAAYLHNFVQSLPNGYNTWVGERGLTLSGGEKQRLAIARTLLMDPRILVLDDSTSSVDAGTEHLIRQALDGLVKGRTTFIITHRLPIIKDADLILLLDRGRIAEMGKHDELMAKNGLYRQTYDAQLADTQVSEGS